MSELTIDVQDLIGPSPSALVVLNGSIDAKTVLSLRTQLASVRDRGVRRFVVDMEHVKYVNSTGLSYLISLADVTNSGEQDLALVKVQPKVKVVFDMMGLDGVFKYCASRDEAVIQIVRKAGAPAATAVATPPPSAAVAPEPPPAAIPILAPAPPPSTHPGPITQRTTVPTPAPAGLKTTTVRVRAPNVPNARLLRVGYVLTLLFAIAVVFLASVVGLSAEKLAGAGTAFPDRVLVATAKIFEAWWIPGVPVFLLAGLVVAGLLDSLLKALCGVNAAAAGFYFVLAILAWARV